MHNAEIYSLKGRLFIESIKSFFYPGLVTTLESHSGVAFTSTKLVMSDMTPTFLSLHKRNPHICCFCRGSEKQHGVFPEDIVTGEEKNKNNKKKRRCKNKTQMGESPFYQFWLGLDPATWHQACRGEPSEEVWPKICHSIQLLEHSELDLWMGSISSLLYSWHLQNNNTENYCHFRHPSVRKIC